MHGLKSEMQTLRHGGHLQIGGGGQPLECALFELQMTIECSILMLEKRLIAHFNRIDVPRRMVP